MSATSLLSGPFSITAMQAFEALLLPRAPLLIDVRRPELVENDPWLVPQARLASPLIAPEALPGPAEAGVIVICAHGHNRSQSLVANLRATGLAASMVADGYDGWRAAGLPLAARAFGAVRLGSEPTLWVTRRGPKIDRVACPWLISRFLDPQAQFLFVDPDQVLAVAADLGAHAFDAPGAPFEHDGELCTFDILLRETGLDRWPPLADLATIIRAADTGRLDLSPQAAGLLALSLGLSQRHAQDDRAMIAEGFGFYDSLLAWIRHRRTETHSWQNRGA